MDYRDIRFIPKGNAVHNLYTAKTGDPVPTGINATGDYLCFNAIGAGAAISASFWGIGIPDVTPVLYHSTDGETWTKWDFNPIHIPENGKVYMYGDNPDGVYGANRAQYLMIKGSGTVTLSGDITTLIRKSGNVDKLPEGAFANLFYFNKSIVSVEDLKMPSTVLSNVCYAAMFDGCENLAKPAKLPKGLTVLPQGAMENMYARTGLTEPVDLRGITSVTTNSLHHFYWNVTTMDYAYAPNVGQWSVAFHGPFSSWMAGVAESGTLYRPTGLEIPNESADGCPTGWTQADYPTE